MLRRSANVEDFGFGFNDQNFSDRVLHLEIIPDDSLPPNLKKHKFTNPIPSNNDSSSQAGIEYKSLYINSLILAAKSPVFYKIFKNGLIGSQGRSALLRVSSSEKEALMDLLNYMYVNTLSATTCSDVVDVMMVAHRFEVICCVKHCIQLLLNMPMSLESARMYLELKSILADEVVKPLIDASKKYIILSLKDLVESEAIAMELPLSAIKLVLGNEGLNVDSEDDVYEFILKWARAHYPSLEERREVITKYLMRFICFQNMSYAKLRKVRDCPDFDREAVSNLVMEALLNKDEVPYGRHIRGSKPKRDYNYRLVKVVHLENPLPSCVVYYDLKKEECKNLTPSKVLLSDSFRLDGRLFYFTGEQNNDSHSASERFGLFVHMEEGSESCVFDIEIGVRKKSSNFFETCCKGTNCTLKETGTFGCLDLFEIPWTTFISDNSKYFVDGVLHLRVELTITNTQEPDVIFVS